ncbi:thiolase family protein [Opitutus sp. ER46]|uniref:thiolase family protein n=1 Tax=Opitutus sp. ER46 TaxID=2161864 RepID=UPI000D323BA4|nr:thiolase family protein [Opitutus sp. ER46]PTX91208.1 acetyl-CoA C-acyltransferase [Opitutus sp. ER46]
MKEAFIVSAVRTPVGKAPQGKLCTVRADDLGALCVREALARAPGLEPAMIDDVIMGCAMPEGSQGFNLARVVVQLAGLPESVPGVTVNRFCNSGLEAIAIGAQRIMSGMGDVVVAGGAESMSLVPMFGYRTTLNPTLVDTMPDAYLSMGLTAENVARDYGISREDQDAFSYQSHQKALAAIEGGRFKEECLTVPVTEVNLGPDQRRRENRFAFDTDEGPRADTSLERLGALKPSFHPKGTVTAGNSSQRSDGAAAVVLMSGDRVRELGLKPIGRFVSYAVGGVAPGVMGIGPIVAIPKALQRAGLTLDQIDLIELNEAFAAQSLAVMRRCELPSDRVNVNGGAIALGHPLGATGAKLTVQVLHELRRRQGRYGLVTMCVGGGMGGAGVIEFLN